MTICSSPEVLLDRRVESHAASAIRLAISLGGDADTQAAIAGGIMEGWQRLDPAVEAAAFGYLDSAMQQVVREFVTAYLRPADGG